MTPIRNTNQWRPTNQIPSGVPYLKTLVSPCSRVENPNRSNMNFESSLSQTSHPGNLESQLSFAIRALVLRSPAPWGQVSTAWPRANTNQKETLRFSGKPLSMCHLRKLSRRGAPQIGSLKTGVLRMAVKKDRLADIQDGTSISTMFIVAYVSSTRGREKGKVNLVY